MDAFEDRISSEVRRISNNVENSIISAIRVLVLPITLPLRLVKVSLPPALHIGILISLIPLLGIFSISAGVLVARWLPTGWNEQVFLQYG